MQSTAKQLHPEQRLDPEYVDAEYREIQNEGAIKAAIGEVDELMSSLVFLDRHAPGESHFKGWRGGEQPTLDAFRALRTIRADLEEMVQ
mgnify:CR=1 FL=1